MKLKFPKSPTTSWVIRTKNEEKWLGEVLKALFMQSRLDFEVVIMDSGSTDRTLEIAKDFPIRKVINLPENEFNYSYALNLGIKKAWGKYVGIISGHSLPVSRTWYQDAMENFSDPKMAAVTGHYTSLPDGSLDEKLGDLFFSLKRLEKEFYCKWMTNTNAIIRKDLWEKVSF
jgi:glycosyltransferase involved in cell wall biosynthesis